VSQWLPAAEQVTLSHCGHVPQVELPEETNELILGFMRRLEHRRARPRLVHDAAKPQRGRADAEAA
jgi:hypothetical protein